MKASQLHMNSRVNTSVRLLFRSTASTSPLTTRSPSSPIQFYHQQPEHQTANGLQTSRSSPFTPASGRRSKLPQRLQNSTRSIRFQGLYDTIPIRKTYSTAATIPGEPTIHSIFEEKTGTWQYLVADPSTLSAVIIDSVLDYDPVTQVISTNTADSLLSLAIEKGYKIDKILETHAHADHLTAAFYLQNQIASKQGHKPSVCIGNRITAVQKLFGKKYCIGAEEYEGVFDTLLEDDETFNIGDLKATVIHLPGHTPDHLGYKIGDNVFCGDSIFHADIGTARCDFPGGSAHDLFVSSHKLLSLPDNVKIWTGHDYPPEDRKTPMACMTVADHKKQNKHLHESISEEKFLQMRKARDQTLGEPRLLHQSLQINVRGGRFPKPTKEGFSFLHLPLKLGAVKKE